MFTSFRSRLTLAFSLLLLVCLCVLSVTFVLLFFVRVSLPELAYVRLVEASLPLLAKARELREEQGSLQRSVEALQDIAREEGMRYLVVAAPGNRVVADTEGEWAGQQVNIRLPSTPQPRTQIAARGRMLGPDKRPVFYLAVYISNARDQAQQLYVVLTISWWETARPFIGSLLTSVLLSGFIAFVLSLLLAFWLARSLSRPLQRAAAAAERVAAGDHGVSLDIRHPDEARRLAQTFNGMVQAVEASRSSQREFVANVSHELRTPLTSIRGFAQAILDGTAGDGPAVQRAASIIQDETDRLSRMVHKLLDLTRIESGEISMSWHQIDLAALVRSCVGQFSLLADEKGVQLVLEAPEPVRLLGDGDRLMQVFTNLIDNALKHTAPRGQVTVRVALAEDSEHAFVSVSDTGCGIPEADLPRVFERFYQVDKSRSRGVDARDRGVGLGLAIASETVRAHGGHIKVDSILDVGTRFTVYLPLKPAIDPQP